MTTTGRRLPLLLHLLLHSGRLETVAVPVDLEGRCSEQSQDHPHRQHPQTDLLRVLEAVDGIRRLLPVRVLLLRKAVQGLEEVPSNAHLRISPQRGLIPRPSLRRIRTRTEVEGSECGAAPIVAGIVPTTKGETRRIFVDRWVVRNMGDMVMFRARLLRAGLHRVLQLRLVVLMWIDFLRLLPALPRVWNKEGLAKEDVSISAFRSHLPDVHCVQDTRQ